MIDPASRAILKRCALAAAVIVAGLWVYDKGGERTRAEWAASIERGKAEVERLKGEAGKVTVKVETEYVEVVKTIREKGDVVVREVPVFVPAGSADLPGGFRVYHDAAAEGAVPDPTRIADAAAVPAEVAAATVGDNYFTCHENTAQLIKLQQWVSEQYHVNPGE